MTRLPLSVVPLHPSPSRSSLPESAGLASAPRVEAVQDRHRLAPTPPGRHVAGLLSVRSETPLTPQWPSFLFLLLPHCLPPPGAAGWAGEAGAWQSAASGSSRRAPGRWSLGRVGEAPLPPALALRVRVRLCPQPRDTLGLVLDPQPASAPRSFHGRRRKAPSSAPAPFLPSAPQSCSFTFPKHISGRRLAVQWSPVALDQSIDFPELRPRGPARSPAVQPTHRALQPPGGSRLCAHLLRAVPPPQTAPRSEAERWCPGPALGPGSSPVAFCEPRGAVSCFRHLPLGPVSPRLTVLCLASLSRL